MDLTKLYNLLTNELKNANDYSSQMTDKKRYYVLFSKILKEDVYETISNPSFLVEDFNVIDCINDELDIASDSFEINSDKFDGLISQIRYMNKNNKMDQIGILLSFYERAFKETQDSYYLIKIAKAYIHINYPASAIKMLDFYLKNGVIYSNEAYRLKLYCEKSINKILMDYYIKTVKDLDDEDREILIRVKERELTDRFNGIYLISKKDLKRRELILKTMNINPGEYSSKRGIKEKSITF